MPNVPLADYVRFLPTAIAVVGITLAEALLLVRAYDRKQGVRSDGGQVLFAFGACNVAGAFSGSLVTGPSASRSAAKITTASAPDRGTSLRYAPT